MISDIISIKKRACSQLLPISSATGHVLCVGSSNLQQQRLDPWPLYLVADNCPFPSVYLFTLFGGKKSVFMQLGATQQAPEN